MTRLIFAVFLVFCGVILAPNPMTGSKYVLARDPLARRLILAGNFLEDQRYKREPPYADACVEAHNEKRCLHNAKGLTWNNGLAQSAQKWADRLAEEGVMMHDPQKGVPRNERQGENLYMIWADYALSMKDLTCQNAVNSWYAELKNYDAYGYCPNGPRLADVMSRLTMHNKVSKTLHFTQLVWRATTEVGVGMALTSDKNTGFIVARYFPAGNKMNHFAENVQCKAVDRCPLH